MKQFLITELFIFTSAAIMIMKPFGELVDTYLLYYMVIMAICFWQWTSYQQERAERKVKHLEETATW